jgi:serine/threonine protein phosphatase PrpC
MKIMIILNRMNSKRRFFNRSLDHVVFQCDRGQHYNVLKWYFVSGFSILTAGWIGIDWITYAEKRLNIKQWKSDVPDVSNGSDLLTKHHKEIDQRKQKTTTEARYTVSSSTTKGDRLTMEDRFYISPCSQFLAVYDGHGGVSIVEFLQENVFRMITPALYRIQLLQDKSEAATRLRRCIYKTFKKIEEQVVANPLWSRQGSTVVGVVVLDKQICSFNIGDSRAVLSRNRSSIDLTRDHKPNDPIERERIEKEGGTVKWYGCRDENGKPLEAYGAYRINGNLAVARAIGDADFRPLVSAEPEVQFFDRDEQEDEFIIVASDGLWDVMNSDEVIEFVHEILDGQVFCKKCKSSGEIIFGWTQQNRMDQTMKKSTLPWRKKQMANYLIQECLFRGASDNITALIVWLK